MQSLLLPALLLAWACPAPAELTTTISASPVGARAREIHQEVDGLVKAAASPLVSNESVSRIAFELGNIGIPGTLIDLRVKLHPWETGPAPKGSSTLDQILRAGKKALLDSGHVPEPDLSEALSYADLLQGQGRIGFAPMPEERRMGEYRYRGPELGSIGLNHLLGRITRLIWDALAYSTVAHEAGHARDHQKGNLSPRARRKGEVRTFAHAEYLYLKQIDPRGEILGTTRIRLEELLRLHPTAKLAAVALSFVTTLDAIFGTEGKEDKLEQVAKELGYEEEDEKHASAPEAPVSS